VLSAAEITTLLALALDPIRAQAHPPSLLTTHARPLQTTTPEHPTSTTSSFRS
jgi:hypothetical protein